MTEASDAADSSTGASRAERIIIDADGAEWRVYERAFSTYDRRSGTSLIFASDAAVRRVRSFPARWAELSDEDLATLSWNS